MFLWLIAGLYYTFFIHFFSFFTWKIAMSSRETLMRTTRVFCSRHIFGCLVVDAYILWLVLKLCNNRLQILLCQGFEIYWGHCKLYVRACVGACVCVCVCVCYVSRSDLELFFPLYIILLLFTSLTHAQRPKMKRTTPTVDQEVKKMPGKTVRKFRNCSNDSCSCIWYDKIKVNSIVRQNKNGIYISIR